MNFEIIANKKTKCYRHIKNSKKISKKFKLIFTPKKYTHILHPLNSLFSIAVLCSFNI